ncbi:MAG: DUF4965 domain-containing protein [Clostridia bacterium]|nr:DUF4965 domain-containing protein [Clostridia bacterium]
MKKRPVAVPLFTVDPYFSVWSCADKLYNGYTKHWTEKPWPIFAGLYVDGAVHVVAGTDADYKTLRNRIHQTDLQITPLSTIYTFENHIAKVKLTFTTPLLLDRLDIMTRPVSYLAYEVEIKKEAEDVQFVFGISAQGCVNSHDQDVTFKKTPYSMCCGNVVQNPLAESGDRVTIDWGYLHLCDPDAYIAEPPKMYGGIGAIGRSTDTRRMKHTYTLNKVYNVHSDAPYLYTVKNERAGVITLAYDEIKPIEYFYEPLDEYYTKYFDSFGSMVTAAVKEYPEIKKLCDAFDAELMAESSKLSEKYEYITSLAYRQAIAAHKLVEDQEGNILFLSKEDDSNGCIGTLDVTYPSIPLFLKYNPELVKGMLRPIIKYANSEGWTFDFTPHDVGRYPIANGQVYGNNKMKYQMPVEEAGNMLLCLAAVKKYKNGDTELFDANKELMKGWVNYLLKYGYDPADQLCTDDFAGRLARNCNLSLKAILGIAAYADLSGDASYMETAKEWAKNWEKDAKADHAGTRLTYDQADSWSMKYNMVWDSLLGYGIFSDEVKQNEIKVYAEKMNRYGVPLDSRASFTKIDWLMWSTCIWEDKDYFDRVCDAIVHMLDETTDRVPMTDWYDTKTAEYLAFINRSVVGGLFINLL